MDNTQIGGTDFFADDEDLHPVTMGTDFFANDEDLSPVEASDRDFFAEDEDLSPVAAEAPEEPTGPTFEDYGRSVMAGGASVVGGMGWLIERAGLDTVGGYLREASKESLESWSSGLSDEARAEMGKKFVTTDKDGDYGIGDASWDTVGLSLAQSLLGTAAGMGAGGAIAKGLTLVPKVTPMIAGVLGMGAGEALVGSGAAGAATEEEVMAMGYDELAKHPEYRAMVRGNGGDIEKAREETARAASGEAAALTAMTTFILSAPMGVFVGKMLGGKAVAKTRLGGIGLGASGEAAQEFGQSGFEEINQNVAIQRNADTDRETTEGALNAAIAGAAAGGIMGGALGASAKVESPESVLGKEMDFLAENVKFTGSVDEIARDSFNPDNAALEVVRNMNDAETIEDVLSYSEAAVSEILGETQKPTATEWLNEQSQEGLPVQNNVQDGVQVDGTVDDLSTAQEPVTDEEMQSRFADRIENNYDELVAEYATLEDAKGGKVLSADTARELDPNYMRDRTRAGTIQPQASLMVKKRYAEMLTQAPAEGEDDAVLFTAGGAGSGKTSALKDFQDINAYQIVYDGNMKAFDGAKKKIDAARAVGKDAHVTMVYRDPVQALKFGALPRAVKQEKAFGTGRTLPFKAFVKTHTGAAQAVAEVAEYYKDDEGVSVEVVDNSFRKGEAKSISLEELAAMDYTDIEQRLTEELDRAYENDEISESIYTGFKGQAPTQDQTRKAQEANKRRNVSLAEQEGSGSNQLAETADAEGRISTTIDSAQEKQTNAQSDTQKQESDLQDQRGRGERERSGEKGKEENVAGASDGNLSSGTKEKESAEVKNLSDIRISEDRETEGGDIVMTSRKADVVMKEIDSRIDSMKALARCLRGG